MALWPFILVKKGIEVTEQLERHEKIHLKQQVEMLLIFFYLWYLLEGGIRWIIYRDFKKAYRNISFEKEAYNHEADAAYKRKPFAWIRYL